MPARATSARAVPVSAERQPRVTPMASTIVNASTNSTAEARKVEAARPAWLQLMGQPRRRAWPAVAGRLDPCHGGGVELAHVHRAVGLGESADAVLIDVPAGKRIGRSEVDRAVQLDDAEPARTGRKQIDSDEVEPDGRGGGPSQIERCGRGLNRD